MDFTSTNKKNPSILDLSRARLEYPLFQIVSWSSGNRFRSLFKLLLNSTKKKLFVKESPRHRSNFLFPLLSIYLAIRWETLLVFSIRTQKQVSKSFNHEKMFLNPSKSFHRAEMNFYKIFFYFCSTSCLVFWFACAFHTTTIAIANLQDCASAKDVGREQHGNLYLKEVENVNFTSRR